MPSVRKALKALFVLGPAVAVALPAAAPAPTVAARIVAPKIIARQASSSAASSSAAASATASAAAAPSASAGALSDTDILNFALTAEHLESTFYSMGFQKFPMSDFMALGLSEANVKSLMQVGMTEATHVSTLISAISAAGAQPVQPCEYNFDTALSDAKTMVATARVLEAVGVSAYLGAAPLVNSTDVLNAAASIVTVESRHQAFIRVASGAEPVPAAFDTMLGPRAVFTLAAQFIKSCPQGSNLNIAPFPSIALQNPANATSGQTLALANQNDASGGMFCAFVAPGGNQFAALQNGNCQVPQNLAGEVYMMITKSQSVADDQVVAGPAVIQPS